MKALAVWGRARYMYLSITEAPHNTESLWMSEEETFGLMFSNSEWFDLWYCFLYTCSHLYTAVQSQNAVAAHFSSKQLLPLGFALQYIWHIYMAKCGQVYSSGTVLPCKAKMIYLLTLQVSRYCLLALQSTVGRTWLTCPAGAAFKCVMYIIGSIRCKGIESMLV